MDNMTKVLLGLGGVGALWLLSRPGSPPAGVGVTQTEGRVLLYHPEIWASGIGNTIEPAIIAALIDRESSGRSEAVGADGEVGLMQVLPGTGQWICGAGANSLKSPVINIGCGTQYLAYTMTVFGSVIGMLAAYNAGPSQVSVDGDTVIAPRSTVAYVKGILFKAVRYRSIFRILPEYSSTYSIMFPPGAWDLNPYGIVAS